MGGSIFGSSSDSKSKTTDKSVQASDQALVNQLTNSGNTKIYDNDKYSVAKGGTLTISSGIDDALFYKSIGDLKNSFASAIKPRDDSTFNNAVLEALAGRTAAATDRAVDEVRTGAPSQVQKWILWAVGAVVLVALFVKFRKRS